MDTSGSENPSFPGFAFAQREALLLAPYAMHSIDSAGRRHPEPPHSYRGPYQRDRDRIVHSAAYRRLSAKTQVFTGDELGDYHRTRLTHTLEVASVARTVARALQLNEDLVEALALAHDIGHPPFGHSGEDTLGECLAAEGGFNHNRQALRIVEQLEVRYPDFPGLNLSLEILTGQLTRFDKRTERDSPLLEVQVVDAADSVAYDTHDADDALELGLVQMDELLTLPLWSEAARRVERRYAALSGSQLRRAVLHELIDWQVGNILEHTSRRLQALAPPNAAAVHKLPVLVAPSDELVQLKKELEAFLYDRVYRHPLVMAKRVLAQDALRQMFTGYLERPELLPRKFQARAERDGLPLSVCDYLAGMTDRFAWHEFQRLFASR